MQNIENSVLLLGLFPALFMIGVFLNLLIRARGGRSLHIALRGFGIDLLIESTTIEKERSEVAEEVIREQEDQNR